MKGRPKRVTATGELQQARTSMICKGRQFLWTSETFFSLSLSLSTILFITPIPLTFQPSDHFLTSFSDK